MFNKLVSSKMSKTMSRDIDNMVTIYMDNRVNNRDFTRDESPPKFKRKPNSQIHKLFVLH